MGGQANIRTGVVGVWLALAVLFAGCPEQTPDPGDPVDITDAGSGPVTPELPCTPVAVGSKYAVCAPEFETSGFHRTSRYELSGSLVPFEGGERQRGSRYVVVGGLSD